MQLAPIPAVASHVTTPAPLASPELAAIETLAQTTQSKPVYRLSRCQVGSNWYFKGIGILSKRGRQWISEGAGQRVFLEHFDIFEKPVGVGALLSPVVFHERRRELPSQATRRQLVDIFFDSKTFAVFPILDAALFEGTIVRAYDVEAGDVGRRASAEACLWAMVSVAARTVDAQQFGLCVEAHDCIDEAMRLLGVVNGDTNLDSLQATLLLWAYQKMKGQFREASITFRSACHIICDLGGHFPLSPSVISPQQIPSFDAPSKSHIRNLFWICYCFDKDASLRSDRPPLLTSDDCDVSEYESPSNQTHKQSRDVNLARIKEKASRLLCSPQAFKNTESELLAHVRQADDELEEWRLSIEPRYRPRLSILSSSSFSLPSVMSLQDRTYLINLQLDYLFTIINIHTLVRKCGDLHDDLPDDLHSAVHSSADLSIEASRSIFRILGTLVDFWKEDSVWIVSHYAPMAAMPLFINILIHPVGQPADSDLQILSSISDITRKIPVERLSKEEVGHVQEISEFVVELVRLGHGAAWKAKRGERQLDLDFLYKT